MMTPTGLFDQYPRPQLERSQWTNLNGLWKYCICKDGDRLPDTYDGDILVPFCLESPYSKVQRQLQPDQYLYYKRHFTYTKKQGNQLLLHFGAVDYEAHVYINKVLVGKHTGGYLPFEFDISSALQEGDNEIIVRVWDPTDKGIQQKGKQKLKHGGIYYTPTSGIWQTVWLEEVPIQYIHNIKMTPCLKTETLEVQVFTDEDAMVEYEVCDGEVVITSGRCLTNNPHRIEINGPKLWTPDRPFLYTITFILDNGDLIKDKVKSYFAMRSFGMSQREDGKSYFTLNNEEIIVNGVLDQGYWPEGLYTPPNEKALKRDVELAKELGFNMMRKHIKIEPLRWYYYCDVLGMMVWQDMPSGGHPTYTHLEAVTTIWGGLRKYDKRDDTWYRKKLSKRSTKEAQKAFEGELKEMIDCLYNSPSIGAWIVFNEAWGQYDAKRIATWCMEYDKSRLVDEASGWFHQGAGHMHSTHIYNMPLYIPKTMKDRYSHQAYVVSEYGGYTLSLAEHLHNHKKTFGYGQCDSIEDFNVSLLRLMGEEVTPLVKQGCAGLVYTQLTDIEDEINGLITYDRKVVKAEQGFKDVNNKISHYL